ncbi:potassium channel family protein [Chloroflexota bacterium]
MKKRLIPAAIDAAQREALLLRIQRLTEAPLLILAFVMIPLLIGPLFWNLSTDQEALFTALDTFIWAIFAVDQGIKIAVAPHRVEYLRRHWLEVLVVAVPFLRPLRLIRIFLFGSRAWVGVRRLVHVDFIFVYGIGLVIIAATIVASVEMGENSSIHSFGDALWWAMATITTVGYGDMVPVTAAGRAMGFVLMLGGIAFFSGITANLASFLVRGGETDRKKLTQLITEIKTLRQEVTRLSGDADREKG